jgi:hypothetical protein
MDWACGQDEEGTSITYSILVGKHPLRGVRRSSEDANMKMDLREICCEDGWALVPCS